MWASFYPAAAAHWPALRAALAGRDVAPRARAACARSGECAAHGTCVQRRDEGGVACAGQLRRLPCAGAAAEAVWTEGLLERRGRGLERCATAPRPPLRARAGVPLHHLHLTLREVLLHLLPAAHPAPRPCIQLLWSVASNLTLLAPGPAQPVAPGAILARSAMAVPSCLDRASDFRMEARVRT
jgi:hypothetical protein